MVSWWSIIDAWVVDPCPNIRFNCFLCDFDICDLCAQKEVERWQIMIISDCTEHNLAEKWYLIIYYKISSLELCFPAGWKYSLNISQSFWFIFWNYPALPVLLKIPQEEDICKYANLKWGQNWWDHKHCFSSS